MAKAEQHWLGDTKLCLELAVAWQYVNDGTSPANPVPACDCPSPLLLYGSRKLWNMSGENGRGN